MPVRAPEPSVQVSIAETYAPSVSQLEASLRINSSSLKMPTSLPPVRDLVERKQSSPRANAPEYIKDVDIAIFLLENIF